MAVGASIRPATRGARAVFLHAKGRRRFPRCLAGLRVWEAVGQAESSRYATAERAATALRSRVTDGSCFTPRRTSEKFLALAVPHAHAPEQCRPSPCGVAHVQQRFARRALPAQRDAKAVEHPRSLFPHLIQTNAPPDPVVRCPKHGPRGAACIARGRKVTARGSRTPHGGPTRDDATGIPGDTTPNFEASRSVSSTSPPKIRWCRCYLPARHRRASPGPPACRRRTMPAPANDQTRLGDSP